MFRATTRPWRRACWAVGGQAAPVAGSGIAAQSPIAHTPGHSGTSMKPSTRTRPRSRAQGRPSINGWTEVPAVHTSVRVAIAAPSESRTPWSVTSATRRPSRISTPRAASLRSAYSPSESPSSGRMRSPEWTSTMRSERAWRFG